MAQSVFDVVADQLAERTDLEKLEARGTVRLALKVAGLDARNVTAEQMRVVLREVMPFELKARGVRDPEEVCASLGRALERCDDQGAKGGSSPEDVFRRLSES